VCPRSHPASHYARGFSAPSPMARSALPGGRPPGPPGGPLWGVVLVVGLLLAVGLLWWCSPLGFCSPWPSSRVGWVTAPGSLVLVPGCAWQGELTLALLGLASVVGCKYQGGH